MENFRIIRPSAALAPFVRYYWLLESDSAETQRIIPSGNMELVFHRGKPMAKGESRVPVCSLSGQSVTFSDLIPMGRVKMIVAVFRPFGAKAFFDMPLDLLSGNPVSADDLSVKALKELEDKILNTTDDDMCIRLIEDFLIGRLNPFKEYNYRRMAAAVNAINGSGGTVSVSELAESVNMSDRQFRRVFIEHVGLMPKEFMRVVRFHKALYTLQHNPAITFTQLAHDCGYYDQAHLINEFKLFSGYTPVEYIALCAPCSDYFTY